MPRVLLCGAAGAGKSTLAARLPAKALVVEVPDDDQSARSMVTHAPTTDLAVILADASSGIVADTQRQTNLAVLLRMPHVVFAINKVDLVGYSKDVSVQIEREYREFAGRVGLTPTVIPISALHGDNIVTRAQSMPWYEGPTLMDSLERLPAAGVGGLQEPGAVANQFEASLVWLHHEPLLEGRSCLLTIGTRTVSAMIAPLKYRLDMTTLGQVPARTLQLNEIGVCNVELSQSIAFTPHSEGGDRGRFTLVDAVTGGMLGVGLLHLSPDRAQNIQWQALDVDKHARAELKGQKPCVLWFTGLSAAGKSTIAKLVERRLCELGRHTYLLDGDNVRLGLSKDLGFADADRVENIRRVAEVARLMADAGLIVLVALISPFRAERRMARSLFAPAEFIEVFVDVPLRVAEARDPKGLYLKARRGDLKNFTGIDSAYDVPEHPELRIDTVRLSPEEAADAVLSYLRQAAI